MIEHRLIVLKPDSSYIVEGRLCPIRRTHFQPGEHIISCQKSGGEIVSLKGLEAVGGLCPFCKQSVDISLPHHQFQHPPISPEEKLSKPSLQRHGVRSGKWLIPVAIVVALIACLLPAGIFILYQATNNSREVRESGSNSITTPRTESPTLTPIPSLTLISVSTSAPSLTPTKTPSASATPVNSCPNAPSQRVRVGDQVWVCTKYDRLIVRSQPRLSGREITRLEPGTYVEIIDGPICANDFSWWKIRANSGTIGWVSEGGDDVDPYFICPVR